MLTPEERNKFLRALNNPSSELAQQLLASDELEKEKQAPWWEATALDEDVVQSGTSRQFGAKPEMMQIPSDMIKSEKASFLVYNLCAIWWVSLYALAYLCWQFLKYCICLHDSLPLCFPSILFGIRKPWYRSSTYLIPSVTFFGGSSLENFAHIPIQHDHRYLVSICCRKSRVRNVCKIHLLQCRDPWLQVT
jgi:hypothetical protein